MNLRAQLIASGKLKAPPKPEGKVVADFTAIMARRACPRTQKAMSILREAARRTA